MALLMPLLLSSQSTAPGLWYPRANLEIRMAFVPWECASWWAEQAELPLVISDLGWVTGCTNSPESCWVSLWWAEGNHGQQAWLTWTPNTGSQTALLLSPWENNEYSVCSLSHPRSLSHSGSQQGCCPSQHKVIIFLPFYANLTS